jgi:hypothetical protein
MTPLALIDSFAPTIDRLDAEVHERATVDPRVKVLTALPGVGEFTALVILAEVGDIARFPTARKLAAWAGLTPTVRGSDLTVRHGHIWKAGRGPAAVDRLRGGADRQAAPRLRRHLHRDGPPAGQEDRHHRGRPQATHPRLSPAQPGGHRRSTPRPDQTPRPEQRDQAGDGRPEVEGRDQGDDQDQDNTCPRCPPDSLTHRDGHQPRASSHFRMSRPQRRAR